MKTGKVVMDPRIKMAILIELGENFGLNRSLTQKHGSQGEAV